MGEVVVQGAPSPDPVPLVVCRRLQQTFASGGDYRFRVRLPDASAMNPGPAYLRSRPDPEVEAVRRKVVAVQILAVD